MIISAYHLKRPSQYVRTTHDALWKKKEELERLQSQGGNRRVFIVGSDQVTAENPNYERFLAAQISKHGRAHSIIAPHFDRLDDLPDWRFLRIAKTPSIKPNSYHGYAVSKLLIQLGMLIMYC